MLLAARAGPRRLVFASMNESEASRPLPPLASSDDGLASLHACLSSASFWAPDRIGPQLPWLEHAPFAFWLVEALRPGTLVELGTHGGFSYFAFCQAVRRCGLETRCFAVDTWTGDEHAGFYDGEVFADVTRYNERQYSAFSTLIRSTFDEAVRHFSDGSIDLLHLDGRHFYEDVKHDFETWRPKLSERAVVVFHDTNTRERGFGVFRLWQELRQNHAHFEFLHGNGLGVLGVGRQQPPTVQALLTIGRDPQATVQIRDIYARLGLAVRLTDRLRDAQNRSAALQAQLAQASVDVAWRDTELMQARGQATQLAHALEASKRDLEATRHDLETTRRELETTKCHVETTGRALETARVDLSSVMASTSWRLTWPIRQLGLALPRLSKFTRQMFGGIRRKPRWTTAQLLADPTERPQDQTSAISQRDPGLRVVDRPSL